MVPHRTLGRTGESVSCIGLGGHHLGLPSVSQQDAIAIVRSAIDRGVNFLDNSWDYNEGRSENRMGKALSDGYRDKVFLMTKIDGRSKKEATKQLDESLKRLRTDHIELVQHHEIIRYEDPHRIFEEKEGANAALLEAKKAGKLLYIGFTGHKDPHIHLHTLDVAREHGFTFDTVQMPLNVMDAHYRSFEQMVLPRLLADNIGVLGMKSMGNGVILKSKIVEPTECLRYALSLETCVVITGCESMPILDQAIAVASAPALSAQERSALLERTRQFATHGQFEPFKTSSLFDSTAEHPEWLGDEPSSVQAMMPG